MRDQEVVLHNAVVILTGNGWPGSYSKQYSGLYWPVKGDQEVILNNTVVYTDR
jgi:hypothetical protein